jgi:squalene-associated FAD-dependent desaturase
VIRRAVVVGGGCAGLSAATALAERGVHVRLLEARRTVGGRSRSWTDPETGDVEDNGQHLVMGCYDEFLRFARRTGGIEHLRFQDRLEIPLLEPTGRRISFRLPPLPRPLDLAWALFRLRGFPVRDVVAARGLIDELRRGGPTDERLDAERWLRGHGQGDEALRRLWSPLVLATVNVDPGSAPATLMGEVLRRALLAGPRASRLGFPDPGLGAVVAEPAVRYLRERGAELVTGAPVRRIEWGPGGRFAAAVTRDGERHGAEGAVLAAPHGESAILLGESSESFGAEQAKALAASPIVAVHLWLDPLPALPPLLGLLDSPMQWVFPRDGNGRGGTGGYLALVVSGADDMVGLPRKEIRDLALSELRRYLPELRSSRLVRWRVIKERRATPALRPETLSLRPRDPRVAPNLVLAGDWVDTGLPATLEAAADSGHRAADSLLSCAPDRLRSGGGEGSP